MTQINSLIKKRKEGGDDGMAGGLKLFGEGSKRSKI